MRLFYIDIQFQLVYIFLVKNLMFFLLKSVHNTDDDIKFHMYLISLAPISRFMR
jgi:hypothetical protein